jgi:putative PEP-CTERM system TPR-repeat lipoprotein
VYLNTGRAKEALATLAPAVQAHPDDPMLLRAVGEAHLASGDAESATTAYERANTLDKSNLGSQVRLAQVRLAAGDTARAFSDLESLAEKDPTHARVDLTLFNEHLRRRQYDQALAVADALEKKQPKSAMPSSLRGIVYLAKRDLKNARRSFEHALEIQPDNTAAANSLAVIDMREGQPETARKRYESILAKDPKNEMALLASAELLVISGGTPAEVRAAIDKVIAIHPTSVRARVALMSFLSRQRDSKGLVAAAQAAVVAIPNQPQLLEALGKSQFAGKDYNQAIETFKQLVRMQPKNPLVLLSLADAQIAVKDYAGALDSGRKALALKPDLAQGWIALAKTHISSGKPDAAVAEARKLQKDRPDKAFGYALEGEVLATQGKWPEAATMYRTALAKQPSPQLAARVYGSLQRAGKEADAAAMAEQWNKDHPTDATLVELVAQQNLQRKSFPAAIEGYKRVVEISPNDVSALNNLAWILAESKDPKAVEYAERAHQLAPFNAGVLDTLGWALAKNGEAKRGAQLLRMATALAPMQSDIRLHLAKVLIDAGDKPAARKELVELSKLDKASPVRIEAEKLQSTL